MLITADLIILMWKIDTVNMDCGSDQLKLELELLLFTMKQCNTEINCQLNAAKMHVSVSKGIGNEHFLNEWLFELGVHQPHGHTRDWFDEFNDLSHPNVQIFTATWMCKWYLTDILHDKLLWARDSNLSPSKRSSSWRAFIAGVGISPITHITLNSD